MDREQIISFIEKIRPQIKEAGAPEDVLLKAAREHNLAPAQLESTAQMLNTAQQLNFMDKSANRGDTFRLIDVPVLLDRFVQHETPKMASEKTPFISDKMGSFEKAASPATTKDGVPLQGKRAPNINAKLLKDAGVPEPTLKLEAVPTLPRTARSIYRETRSKEAAFTYELAGVQQMIADQQEVLRKVAEEVAFRIRTEPQFSWAEAKSDALVLNKSAAEKISPVIEDYLGQLGGHRKVAFTSEPAAQPSILVEDRHGIMSLLVKGSEAVEMIEKLAAYREHVKSSAMTEPPQSRVPKNQEEGGSADTDPDEDEDEDEDDSGGPGPKPTNPEKKPESGRVAPPGISDADLIPSLEDIIMPPADMTRSPEEINQSISKGIDEFAGGIKKTLEPIPGPGKTHSALMDLIKSHAPTTNKKQRTIDQGVSDVRTVTTLQRLMLTDPIIRDADPDMVLSLYNTLQNANPEVTQDPNLLRFALRESLQYESVPMHTYKDLVEVDEKKQKAREMAGKNQDKRYAV